MRRPIYFLVLLVVALAAPTPSSAAGQRKRGVAPPMSAQDEAKELYKKAMTHYEIGAFDDAIAEFKRAYELTSAPGLLFNIAQVYRMKKDAEQAVYFYRTYLRLSPDAPNRADVEALIAENQRILDDGAAEKRRADAQGAAAAPAGATPSPAAASSPPASPPPPPRPRPWRAELWSGVASGAVGVGALAAAVALGVRSSTNANAISSANAQGDLPWDAQKQQQYRDGQTFASAATAMYVVGGALVATGAVLVGIGLYDRSRMRSFAITPTAHGVALGMSCAF